MILRGLPGDSYFNHGLLEAIDFALEVQDLLLVRANFLGHSIIRLIVLGDRLALAVHHFDANFRRAPGVLEHALGRGAPPRGVMARHEVTNVIVFHVERTVSLVHGHRTKCLRNLPSKSPVFLCDDVGYLGPQG